MQTITRTISADKLSKVMQLPKSLLGHNLSVTISCPPEKHEEAESNDPFYSESNMAHLRRGIVALNAGKGEEHDIIEVSH